MRESDGGGSVAHTDSADLDYTPPSPGSLLALFEGQRRTNCAAALRRASQSGWTRRDSRETLPHPTAGLNRSRRARMSQQGWGSGDQPPGSTGSESCPGRTTGSALGASLDVLATTPPQHNMSAEASTGGPTGSMHILDDVDECHSIGTPSHASAGLSPAITHRLYGKLFSCAVGILTEYEAHARETLVAAETREVRELNRRFEDVLSSLCTSNSLIQVTQMMTGRQSPARDWASPHQGQRSPGGGVRVGLNHASNSALLSSLQRNSTLMLDGSLRSIAASGRFDGASPHIDLSDTQQTMVVRDAGDDDDDDGECPWGSLDRDACLARPPLPQAGMNHIALRSPSLASCRDVIAQCAAQESERQAAETRSILMAHVEPENPLDVLAISRDAAGERVVLGEGSYGRVYHATTRADPQERAVKLIFLDQLEGGDWEIRDIVLNEILILSNIAHPNIVRYYGTYYREGYQGSELWCVMECCRGRSLFDLVFPPGAPRRVFTDPEIAKVARDVLAALQYLIGEGWIHRDVKLENVLSDGRAMPSFMLSDFGLSRPCGLKECHRSSTIEGTLEYLGPEGFNTLEGIITGVPQCTTSHKGDIYAFGIAVLIMAGVDTTRNIARPERYKVPVFDPKCFGPGRADLTQRLSPSLLAFVVPCLEHAPEARPYAQQLLSHPFLSSANSTASASANGYPNLCTRRELPHEPCDEDDATSSSAHSNEPSGDPDDDDCLAQTSRGMRL
eukprot:TRINITY_DN11023_c0_g1_i3.p1 TRINITY_DN11023_c0_g1~~TRINITY_DN11023_c0_g1_i3.p1  ORF type:complete len:735 (+),score=103.05 TRINITY_DN11023_c0_g1_i3:57-2261(+)